MGSGSAGLRLLQEVLYYSLEKVGAQHSTWLLLVPVPNRFQTGLPQPLGDVGEACMPELLLEWNEWCPSFCKEMPAHEWREPATKLPCRSTSGLSLFRHPQHIPSIQRSLIIINQFTWWSRGWNNKETCVCLYSSNWIPPQAANQPGSQLWEFLVTPFRPTQWHGSNLHRGFICMGEWHQLTFLCSPPLDQRLDAGWTLSDFSELVLQNSNLTKLRYKISSPTRKKVTQHCDNNDATV